ncbi:hypothetical protein LIER_19019 [Lithospermum erythrorhizon]|uniref:Uncharacterized protein n=1 Tax=Lithospermum erythrorhizon TaxID=34254 RepID=A0AAV3QG44_LITER
MVGRVCAQMEDRKMLPKPHKLRSPPNRRDKKTILMLADMGSLADIVYLAAYDRLGLPRNLLKPACTPLTGFTGHSIYSVGIAELDFTMGEAPRTSTIKAYFTVEDISDPSYNGLIDRPILIALRAIVSPLHLKMKFPTTRGVGEVSGD